MRIQRKGAFWFPFALIIVGIALLLDRFHVMWIGWSAVFWLLVACAGGVELFNGITRRLRWKTVWGTIWLAVGGMFFLQAEDVIAVTPGIAVGGIFLACGAGFLLALARRPADWYLAVPGLCALLVGGAIMSTETGWLAESVVAPMVNTWWPAALILFGAALIAHGLVRTRDGVSGPPASSSPSPHPR